MKVCCIADLHGHLPAIPPCDLLLIAGDIVPTSCHRPRDAWPWLRDSFGPWLDGLGFPAVGVAGNHDYIFERAPHLVPRLPWTYLQDSGAEVLGLKVWGSPWQPRFFDWAFNLDEPELVEKWSLIPDDTDILLLHGPPLGYGDLTGRGLRHVGSPSLTERIVAVRPRLAVAGHIHSGRGVYRIGETTFVNASVLDEEYRPVFDPPIVVDL